MPGRLHATLSIAAMLTAFVMVACADSGGSPLLGANAPSDDGGSRAHETGCNLGQNRARERESRGERRHRRQSDHFALKWNTADVSDQAATHILETAERAYAHFVDHLQYPPPTGSPAFRVNIYVETREEGATSSHARRDADGYPYIVLSASNVDPGPRRTEEQISALVTHEFFHLLQLSVPAFDGAIGDPGSLQLWYWEATAEWAAAQLTPLPVAMDHLDSYVLYPDFGLHTALPWTLENFDRYDDILFTHQYGAGIFPHYLSEYAANADLIRSSWLEAGVDDNPLTVLAELLKEHGTDLATAFTNFAVHTTTLDYVGAAEFERSIQRSLDENTRRSRYSVWHATPPTRFYAPTSDVLPDAYGYNVIQVFDLPPRLEVEVDEHADSEGALRAVALIERDSTTRRVDLTRDGHRLVGELTGLDAEDRLLLIIAATPASPESTRQYPYRYRFAPR